MGTSLLVCGAVGILGLRNLLREDDGNIFKFAFWFLVLLGCVLFPIFVMIAVS